MYCGQITLPIIISMKFTKTNVQNFLRTLTKSEISNIIPVSGGDWSHAFFLRTKEM